MFSPALLFKPFPQKKLESAIPLLALETNELLYISLFTFVVCLSETQTKHLFLMRTKLSDSLISSSAYCRGELGVRLQILSNAGVVFRPKGPNLYNTIRPFCLSGIHNLTKKIGKTIFNYYFEFLCEKLL